MDLLPGENTQLFYQYMRWGLISMGRLESTVSPRATAPRRSLNWAIAVSCFITLSIAENSGFSTFAQETASDLPVDSASADEPAELNFDELLNLAEQDLSKLSQVKVSTQAPAMSVEVTTVSRTPSTVGKTPAAVFVITNEMIRRSGATSVPEVLRMAPGVQVARIDSNKWAISIRGFNDRFANKLLVQVDGRTVYSPLYAGVFWDAQDVMLEDVERIEVIRGPGASVWGANAVNGVINILTKKASDTQGLFAQSGAGNYERGFVNLRYGGKLGEDVDYRVFGRLFERGTGTSLDSVSPPADDWRMGRGGFRMDWDLDRAGDDIFTLEGDSYAGVVGGTNSIPTLATPFVTTVANDGTYSGTNILGRWTHKVDEGQEWQLQSYYSRTGREINAIGFFEDRDTFDIDFQYRLPLGERHKLVTGAAARWTSDRLPVNTFPTGFSQSRQTISMYSAFLQDEIELVEDHWILTLGTKFVQQSYVGFDYQPTAKLLFAPDERRSVWLSVSRAIRLPSRGEETALLYGAPIAYVPDPVYSQIVGSDSLKSEQLLAWELGYRAQPVDRFSWDVATFFNQYQDLIGFQQGGLASSPYGLVAPLTAGNLRSARTYGCEVAANLELRPGWNLRSAYTYLSIFHDGNVLGGDATEGSSPRHQLYAQSSWTLRERTELDLIGRYVGALPGQNVPSYFVGDARVAWHPSAAVEWFIVGRGMFDDGHQEFGSDVAVGGLATGVRSEIYGGVTLKR